MFKYIMDWLLIILLGLGMVTHFFRLIYALFKPKILEKYTFLYNPNKVQLILYYILVIAICYNSILYKLSHF